MAHNFLFLYCRFKLLNWWAQNFLVNVAHIICGFRDDHGVIDNIAFYKVEEIPKMARVINFFVFIIESCHFNLNVIHIFSSLRIYGFQLSA